MFNVIFDKVYNRHNRAYPVTTNISTWQDLNHYSNNRQMISVKFHIWWYLFVVKLSENALGDLMRWLNVWVFVFIYIRRQGTRKHVFSSMLITKYICYHNENVSPGGHKLPLLTKIESNTCMCVHGNWRVRQWRIWLVGIRVTRNFQFLKGVRRWKKRKRGKQWRGRLKTDSSPPPTNEHTVRHCWKWWSPTQNKFLLLSCSTQW